MAPDLFPDEVEVRVVEYAPGKFAPVVSRGGQWQFLGGRVFYSRETAESEAAGEVAFQKKFWADQLANRSNAAVVDGEHFRIGTRTSGTRGFGGQTFHLRDLATGEVTKCSDLWRQGLIPDFARSSFPDTHEFTAPDGEQVS
jgi:hypothetical protein